MSFFSDAEVRKFAGMSEPERFTRLMSLPAAERDIMLSALDRAEEKATLLGPAVEHVKMDVPGYANLADVLIKAYEQSAKGKGKERHANDKPFDRQPIMEIGRMVGPGYQLGQAQKKAQEAFGMFSRGQHDRAMAEILGAIVYAAAAYLTIEEATATPVAASPAGSPSET